MRMERLELSKQKLLGPKSSASTNFATSAFHKEQSFREKGRKDIIIHYSQ